TEREILADELRREMSASIMRRIDSVVRAELEGRGPVKPAAPVDVPVQPPVEPAVQPSTTPIPGH
ncbi:MAG TPA: hypothetical protein DCM50_13875, partial [Stenotrophomonas sp.]|nr:hypothetical protein [Stenotrophomonas sp.]